MKNITTEIVNGHIKVKSKALDKYPKCLQPLKIRVQSVVRPLYRLPLGEWLNFIYRKN